MNIFVLDRDIEACARAHCDQHVNKMVLESVQLLCTALNKNGFSTPYRSTHQKHPCVMWVEESFDNFVWLRELALALNRESQWRYGRARDHASIRVLREIEIHRFAGKGMTEFRQAMPQEYKVEGDPVAAYRNFYLGEKSRFATWRKREAPDWYLAGREDGSTQTA